MAGQRGEVHERGRVVGQAPGGVVDGEPTEIVGGQRADLESVGGHDRQVGAVLAGQTGDGAFAGPAAEQDVECVVGAGGEDDVGAAQAGECADGGAARVEHRSGGLRGDVPADLCFMPGVLCCRVDDRKALP